MALEVFVLLEIKNADADDRDALRHLCGRFGGWSADGNDEILLAADELIHRALHFAFTASCFDELDLHILSVLIAAGFKRRHDAFEHLILLGQIVRLQDTDAIDFLPGDRDRRIFIHRYRSVIIEENSHRDITDGENEHEPPQLFQFRSQ